MSANKIIQWQPIFITNFITVTEKASSQLSIFSNKVFPFPLVAAGNYVIHKMGDCTVLIEVNTNRKRIFLGWKKTLPVGSEIMIIFFLRQTICLYLYYS